MKLNDLYDFIPNPLYLEVKDALVATFTPEIKKAIDRELDPTRADIADYESDREHAYDEDRHEDDLARWHWDKVLDGFGTCWKPTREAAMESGCCITRTHSEGRQTFEGKVVSKQERWDKVEDLLDGADEDLLFDVADELYAIALSYLIESEPK